MKIAVSQQHVEWYNRERDTFHSCLVLRYYSSLNAYRIKVGGSVGYLQVPEEDLAVRASLYKPSDWSSSKLKE